LPTEEERSLSTVGPATADTRRRPEGVDRYRPKAPAAVKVDMKIMTTKRGSKRGSPMMHTPATTGVRHAMPTTTGSAGMIAYLVESADLTLDAYGVTASHAESTAAK
jgi:hypothetical protein